MGMFFKGLSVNKTHILDRIWNNFCQILDRHTYALQVTTYLKPQFLFSVILSTLLFPTCKEEVD